MIVFFFFFFGIYCIKCLRFWRVVRQKDYWDSGQEPGVGYGPDSPSHGVFNR
jgi:hypothetical protein